MKNFLKFAIIFAISLGVFSCSKSDSGYDAVNPVVSFKASLSGANEQVPNPSTAIGSAIIQFNTTTKILTLSLTHTLAAATGGHIHKGAAGTSGPVEFPLQGLVSPATFTSPALTAAQEADLNAGIYYINLHSAAYPGGEIRGQIIK